MKKQIIVLSTLCSLNIMAQEHSCGFDHILEQNKEFYPKNTEHKEKNQIFNNFKNNNQTFSANTFTPYSGPIYEIPVVVHILESKYVGQVYNNNNLKLTDEEIKQWIENANKMYATTYGNGFFPEGDGPKGGAVIPFKLVLAQRTKDLKPTNGILRYDGDTIEGYGIYGVKEKITQLNAPTSEQIRAFAPHWDENLYYNIYVVVGVDGNKSDVGLAGWAASPDFPDSKFDTFVAAARVKKQHDVFLAHEFGHSLGLLHPFGNASSTTCPSNNNCSTDNDKVCDTEPVRAFPCYDDGNGTCIRAHNDTDTNPCTGQIFQGTQYNIMAYAYEARKFTVGQRERALTEFFKNNRGKLLAKSRGGEEMNTANEVTLKSITCSNNNIDRWFPTEKTRKITFGSIESEVKNKILYTDYTSNSKLYKGSYTDLIENKAETLTIESENGNNFHAWIDYNNNGTFEANERITPKNGLTIPASKKVTLSVTPPANAVKNTYVRLRILTDDITSQPCPTEMMDGNINDFAVRIVEEKLPDPEPISEPTEIYTGKVGINTITPKVTLEIGKNTSLNVTKSQGVLFPSFTTEERSKFENVTEGTMIFNTDLKCLEVYKGSAEGWDCVK